MEETRECWRETSFSFLGRVRDLKKTWYVPCSPRNPEKLAPELKLLQSLEGHKWNKRSQDGELVTQIRFAELLKSIKTFEGEISVEPAFSARDRVKPFKSFGFAYIDDHDRIRITKAGRQLIEGKRVHELFLKQLLKWQYPSYQHKGSEYEPPGSPLEDFMQGLRKRQRPGFYTLPFFDSLQIIRDANGTSKQEIALFLLPKIVMGKNPDLMSEIVDFRQRFERIKGRVPRRRFVLNALIRKYSRLYREEVKKAKNDEAHQFIMKKVRNSIDVADAAIRYFRYTGLLTIAGNRLSISPGKKGQVDQILRLDLKPVEFFGDCGKFYEYMGDPEIPALPFEEKGQLVLNAKQLYKELHSLGTYAPIVAAQIPPIPRDPFALDVSLLKDLIETYEQKRFILERIRLEQELRHPRKLTEIVGMYGQILEKEVVDPPTYLEWNTWRAVVFMDQASKVTPNFSMDRDMQPLSHAPGNKADIEAEYSGFTVLVEVSLASGRRQYFTETEPVTAHVGDYQKRVVDGTAPVRKVYGLFVAPKLHESSIEHFFLHMRIHPVQMYGGFITVIPLTLDSFLDLTQFAASVNSLTQDEIRTMLEMLSDSGNKAKSASEWIASFPSVIGAWKEKVKNARSNR